MSIESLDQPSPSPLDLLYEATAESLTPEMVQEAINWLDPNKATALLEAEEVFGFAAYGASQHPESEEWSEIQERAGKVYHHRELLAARKSN